MWRRYAERLLRVRDGRIVEDRPVAEATIHEHQRIPQDGARRIAAEQDAQRADYARHHHRRGFGDRDERDRQWRSKQIENQISSLGTNQLTIFPGSSNVGGVRGGFGSAPPLTEKDLRAVRDARCRRGGGVRPAQGNVTWCSAVPTGRPGAGRQRRDPAGTGLAGAKGRFFDAREASVGAKVAVLGATVAKRIVRRRRSAGFDDPHQQFAVPGHRRAQRRKGRPVAATRMTSIMVPISTARSRLVGRLGAPDQIGALLVKVDERYNLRGRASPTSNGCCGSGAASTATRTTTSSSATSPSSCRRATRQRRRWACCWRPLRPYRWWSAASAS